MRGDDFYKTENIATYHNYMDSEYSTALGAGNIFGTMDFSNYEGGIISLDDLMRIVPGADRNYAGAALAALVVLISSDLHGDYPIGPTDEEMEQMCLWYEAEYGQKGAHEK